MVGTGRSDAVARGAASGGEISRFTAWVLASRPKTLPAAVVPVVIGSAAAYSDETFVALPALVALLCALLIQIATNLANDYFDFIKGADSKDRLGPTRVTQSGLIPPDTVRRAMLFVLAVTFVLGLYLVSIAGWPILLIGVVSLLCAVAYTAGPLPLAYVGLGDLFVFLFFGIVAVTGTYYVQALTWSSDALLSSLPVGAISTAIIVVNNYRDIDTDAAAGKRTMAVRLGRAGTRVEYAVLLLIAYAVPLLQFTGGAAAWILLPLLSIPLAIPLLRLVFSSTDGPELNGVLAGTGRLLAVFGLLYCAGIIMS